MSYSSKCKNKYNKFVLLYFFNKYHFVVFSILYKQVEMYFCTTKLIFGGFWSNPKNQNLKKYSKGDFSHLLEYASVRDIRLSA
jgi:hypothetical protein